MAKSEKKSLTPDSSSFPSIIESSRIKLNSIIAELKIREEPDQATEFALSKVEAELQSLEATLTEIATPSEVGFSNERNDVLNASIGKLLPYFLINLDKLTLQCGIESDSPDRALITRLFELNPEFNEVLLNKS